MQKSICAAHHNAPLYSSIKLHSKCKNVIVLGVLHWNIKILLWASLNRDEKAVTIGNPRAWLAAARYVGDFQRAAGTTVPVNE